MAPEPIYFTEGAIREWYRRARRAHEYESQARLTQSDPERTVTPPLRLLTSYFPDFVPSWSLHAAWITMRYRFCGEAPFPWNYIHDRLPTTVHISTP